MVTNPMQSDRPYAAVAKQCGARTRSGRPCPTPPVVGRQRCRMHGGATPRGIASPHFKTGRYSRDLPTRLAARYAAALRDPKLLELRAEIALMDTRISDLLSQLEDEPDIEHDDAIWRAVGGSIDQRRRLVLSESKRLKEMRQVLTVEQATAFVHALLAAVREHVQDRPTLYAISEAAGRLLRDAGWGSRAEHETEEETEEGEPHR